LRLTEPESRRRVPGVLRVAGEAAAAGLLVGCLVGLVHARTEMVHGFALSALGIAAADALTGLVCGLAALAAVLAGSAAARLLRRPWPYAGHAGLAILATPFFLLTARWVNARLLPGFLEPASLAGNAAMAIGFVVFLVVVPLLVRRRWRAADRPDVRPSWIPWIVAAGLLAAPGVARAVARDDRPPVFLLVIDALRADHLSSYGYGRDTSPHLDRLARDGVRFTHAISSGTFTKTSIASLVTGLDPHRHGVYTGNKEDAAGRITSDVLGDEVETLAEVLLRGGYRTVGWVQQAQLRSFHGFAQGYMEYNEDQGPAPLLTRRALRWLRKRGADGPFFAHLHVLDLHDPYQPPPPYDRRYGWYSDVYGGLDLSEWGKHRNEILEGQRPLSAADVEQLRALYDGQIRYVDDQVGRFFDELRRLGLYDRSLIVVTADHGDGFMEHGFISHSTLAYDELVRVPLLVKLPGGRGAGRVVEDQVRMVDVMPTILEATGLRAPATSGASLLPALEGRAERPHGQALVEFEEGVAVREAAWKYIRLLDGSSELYNLAEDPGERRNVAQDEAATAARFEARAQEVLARRAALAERTMPLDDATIDRLKALGYVR
jgi:arylsulfatase